MTNHVSKRRKNLTTRQKITTPTHNTISEKLFGIHYKAWIRRSPFLLVILTLNIFGSIIPVEDEIPSMILMDCTIETNIDFEIVNDILDDRTAIWYLLRDQLSLRKWQRLVENLVDPSVAMQKEKQIVTCDIDRYERNGQICRPDVILYGECAKINSSECSFNVQSPCVLIKLNKIVFWESEFRVTTRPDMLNLLKRIMNDMKDNRKALIWLSCGDMKLNNVQSFSSSNNQKQLDPSITIKATDFDQDVFIDIKCDTWNSDIIPIGHQGVQSKVNFDSTGEKTGRPSHGTKSNSNIDSGILMAQNGPTSDGRAYGSAQREGSTPQTTNSSRTESNPLSGYASSDSSEMNPPEDTEFETIESLPDANYYHEDFDTTSDADDTLEIGELQNPQVPPVHEEVTFGTGVRSTPPPTTQDSYYYLYYSDDSNDADESVTRSRVPPSHGHFYQPASLAEIDYEAGPARFRSREAITSAGNGLRNAQLHAQAHYQPYFSDETDGEASVDAIEGYIYSIPQSVETSNQEAELRAAEPIFEGDCRNSSSEAAGCDADLSSFRNQEPFARYHYLNSFFAAQPDGESDNEATDSRNTDPTPQEEYICASRLWSAEPTFGYYSHNSHLARNLHDKFDSAEASLEQISRDAQYNPYRSVRRYEDDFTNNSASQNGGLKFRQHSYFPVAPNTDRMRSREERPVCGNANLLLADDADNTGEVRLRSSEPSRLDYYQSTLFRRIIGEDGQHHCRFGDRENEGYWTDETESLEVEEIVSQSEDYNPYFERDEDGYDQRRLRSNRLVSSDGYHNLRDSHETLDRVNTHETRSDLHAVPSLPHFCHRYFPSWIIDEAASRNVVLIHPHPHYHPHLYDEADQREDDAETWIRNVESVNQVERYHFNFLGETPFQGDAENTMLGAIGRLPDEASYSSCSDESAWYGSERSTSEISCGGSGCTDCSTDEDDSLSLSRGSLVYEATNHYSSDSLDDTLWQRCTQINQRNDSQSERSLLINDSNSSDCMRTEHRLLKGLPKEAYYLTNSCVCNCAKLRRLASASRDDDHTQCCANDGDTITCYCTWYDYVKSSNYYLTFSQPRQPQPEDEDHGMERGEPIPRRCYYESYIEEGRNLEQASAEPVLRSQFLDITHGLNQGNTESTTRQYYHHSDASENRNNFYERSTGSVPRDECYYFNEASQETIPPDYYYHSDSPENGAIFYEISREPTPQDYYRLADFSRNAGHFRERSTDAIPGEYYTPSHLRNFGDNFNEASTELTLREYYCRSESSDNGDNLNEASSGLMPQDYYRLSDFGCIGDNFRRASTERMSEEYYYDSDFLHNDNNFDGAPTGQDFCCPSDFSHIVDNFREARSEDSEDIPQEYYCHSHFSNCRDNFNEAIAVPTPRGYFCHSDSSENGDEFRESSTKLIKPACYCHSQSSGYDRNFNEASPEQSPQWYYCHSEFPGAENLDEAGTERRPQHHYSLPDISDDAISSDNASMEVVRQKYYGHSDYSKDGNSAGGATTKPTTSQNLRDANAAARIEPLSRSYYYLSHLSDNGENFHESSAEPEQLDFYRYSDSSDDDDNSNAANSEETPQGDYRHSDFQDAGNNLDGANTKPRPEYYSSLPDITYTGVNSNDASTEVGPHEYYGHSDYSNDGDSASEASIEPRTPADYYRLSDFPYKGGNSKDVSTEPASQEYYRHSESSDNEASTRPTPQDYYRLSDSSYKGNHFDEATTNSVPQEYYHPLEFPDNDNNFDGASPEAISQDSLEKANTISRSRNHNYGAGDDDNSNQVATEKTPRTHSNSLGDSYYFNSTGAASWLQDYYHQSDTLDNNDNLRRSTEEPVLRNNSDNVNSTEARSDLNLLSTERPPKMEFYDPVVSSVVGSNSNEEDANNDRGPVNDEPTSQSRYDLRDDNVYHVSRNLESSKLSNRGKDYGHENSRPISQPDFQSSLSSIEDSDEGESSRDDIDLYFESDYSNVEFVGESDCSEYGWVRDTPDPLDESRTHSNEINTVTQSNTESRPREYSIDLPLFQTLTASRNGESQPEDSEVGGNDNVDASELTPEFEHTQIIPPDDTHDDVAVTTESIFQDYFFGSAASQEILENILSDTENPTNEEPGGENDDPVVHESFWVGTMDLDHDQVVSGETAIEGQSTTQRNSHEYISSLVAAQASLTGHNTEAPQSLDEEPSPGDEDYNSEYSTDYWVVTADLSNSNHSVSH